MLNVSEGAHQPAHQNTMGASHKLIKGMKKLERYKNHSQVTQLPYSSLLLQWLQWFQEMTSFSKSHEALKSLDQYILQGKQSGKELRGTRCYEQELLNKDL